MRRPILRLLLLELAGNALLLALGYFWLGLPESRPATLAWSAFLSLAILAGTCVLHGAAFQYTARPPLGIRPSFAAAVRRLPALLLCAVLIGGIYFLADRTHDFARAPAFRAASFLTLKLRHPVPPASVLRGVDVFIAILRWGLIPVLVLPMVAGVAILGRGGFRCFGLLARSRRYWVLTPLLLVCALWLPFRILAWTPRSASFAVEMASFLGRAAAAYGLFTAAWLAIVFLTATGSPRFTQSKTAVSP
jgi:hypothetical protein